MERKELIAAKLHRERLGLEASRGFFDHSEEVGWINEKYPAATHLRLDVDPLSKFRTLTRPGGIADIRTRLRDVVIPRRLNRLVALESQWADLNLAEQRDQSPSKQEREEELLQREQIFSQEQATIIANLVNQKLGVIFLAPNLSELFTFEIDDHDKKQLKTAIDELSHLPVDPQLGKLDDFQREELRKHTLADLNLLLSSREFLNKTFEENKVSPSMQIFLVWLFEQNEKYGGRLYELLSLPVEYKPPQYRSEYNSYNIELVNRGGRYANVPSNLSLHVKEHLQRYSEQHPPKQALEPQFLAPGDEPKPEGDETTTEDGQEISEPTNVIIFPVPSLSSTYESPKPKLKPLERRDPEIRSTINQYLDQIAEHGITEPISSAAVNRAFQRLKMSVITWLVDDKRFIKPETTSRDGNPTFQPHEIAKALYISYKYRSIGFTSALISDLDEIIEEVMKEREQKKIQATSYTSGK